MDVDDAVRVLLDEARREYLHVASQHDQVGLGAEQGQDPVLGFRLGVRIHRHVMEGDAERLHVPLHGRVVARGE